MADSWQLTIPGEAVAKGRPKLGTVNGHAMAFTPKKTRAYEDVVRQHAVQRWQREILHAVPVALSVVFYRGIAASWPRKKQEQAIAGSLRPVGRPDLDNLVKAITDGMNGVVYSDDALIVETHSAKRYAVRPRVEVTISWGAL